MNNTKKIGFFILVLATLTFSACKDKAGGGGINFFSLEDDKAFGAQVAAEIEADPISYPILDSAIYPEAYAYMYAVRDSILESGNVVHKDDFDWKLKIIHDDSTLNAFCTPGGYIFVYTGLIKFLEAEYEFAGVMGHEIAHADERHSTAALTQQYGIDVLLSVLLGENKGALSQIAQGLVSLKYSRGNETESDMRSVEYLYPTAYDARGAAKFFEKMLELGGSTVPEFLSTHPSPDDRVEAINAHWENLGGKTGFEFSSRYKQFQNSLPK
ncbi:MAG: M48 family metalloprotease [Bacteroidia bacterium]